MKIIDKENLVSNAESQGKYLYKRLSELALETEGNKNIQLQKPRGKGLMIGLKINQPGNNRKYQKINKNLRNSLVDGCYEKGLLILGAGWNNIRFAPPLNVTKENIDEAFDVFSNVVQKIERTS